MRKSATKKKPLRRFTDAELLNAQLRIDDANAIPNIVNERLPDGVKIVDVFRTYKHAKYPTEKIYCCSCGSHQHKIGFHVGRSDGVEATLGNCCAKPKLGHEFVRAAMRNEDEHTRQHYLRQIQDFYPVALRIVKEDMARSWHDLALALREVRQELREVFSQAFPTLQDCAAKNAPLLMPVRQLTTDWKKDDRREEEDSEDRFIWQFVPAFRVAGPELLRRGDPLAIVKDLDRMLINFRRIVADTDSYSTGQLRQLVVALKHAHRGFETLVAMRRAVNEFFAEDHLAAVAGWINSNCEHHGMGFSEPASARGDTISNEWSDRFVKKPALPAFSDELLNVLRAA
jgi:hypothetical protein